MVEQLSPVTARLSNGQLWSIIITTVVINTVNRTFEIVMANSNTSWEKLYFTLAEQLLLLFLIHNPLGRGGSINISS